MGYLIGITQHPQPSGRDAWAVSLRRDGVHINDKRLTVAFVNHKTAAFAAGEIIDELETGRTVSTPPPRWKRQDHARTNAALAK